jgi:hypothetical protein
MRCSSFRRLSLPQINNTYFTAREHLPVSRLACMAKPLNLRMVARDFDIGSVRVVQQDRDGVHIGTAELSACEARGVGNVVASVMPVGVRTGVA